jgi:hypothetical protein
VSPSCPAVGVPRLAAASPTGCGGGAGPSSPIERRPRCRSGRRSLVSKCGRQAGSGLDRRASPPTTQDRGTPVRTRLLRPEKPLALAEHPPLDCPSTSAAEGQGVPRTGRVAHRRERSSLFLCCNSSPFKNPPSRSSPSSLICSTRSTSGQGGEVLPLVRDTLRLSLAGDRQ